MEPYKILNLMVASLPRILPSFIYIHGRKVRKCKSEDKNAVYTK